MRIFLSFATTTCLMVIASCTKDIGPNPDLVKKQTSFCDTITFAKHIKPIIDNNCVNCHFAGSGLADLTTYSGVKAKVDDGLLKARCVDGNPSFMPPIGRLPDEQINLITCWLNSGAPNN